MYNYKLTRKDFDELEELIKITTTIETLYNKLYELEINNKKTTKEYDKMLNCLIMVIELENKKYQESKLNSHKAIAWLDYLLEDRLPLTFENNMESIIKLNNNELTKRRIINNLISKIINCKNEGYSDKMNYLISELEYFKINRRGTNPENYDEFVNNHILKEETINIFLTNLKEQIEVCNKKEEYKKYQEQLIKTKYNISFIHKKNEMNIIENNFNIENIPYIDPITLYGYSLWDEIIKKDYAREIYAFNTCELVNISDDDYDNQEKIIIALLRQANIKTALSLLEEKEQTEIYDGFEKLIKTDKYLSFCPNSKMSELLVKNSFKKKILSRDK